MGSLGGLELSHNYFPLYVKSSKENISFYLKDLSVNTQYMIIPFLRALKKKSFKQPKDPRITSTVKGDNV